MDGFIGVERGGFDGETFETVVKSDGACLLVVGLADLRRCEDVGGYAAGGDDGLVVD